jgi:hypothetical protein
MALLGMRDLVHGLRQDGAEPRARFYVGEWGVFHHVSVPYVNLARLGQA